MARRLVQGHGLGLDPGSAPCPGAGLGAWLRLGILGAIASASVAGPPLARASDPTAPFILYTITGERFGDHLSWSMDRLGDVNGDGIADLVIGVPEHGGQDDAVGKVLVASGKDGAIIHTLRTEEKWTFFGGVVGGVGDVDGDGVDDILAGTAHFIEVRSGRTGALIGTVYPGGDVARGIGDVDGDGAADFVVGDSTPLDSTRGRCTVYSGGSRQELWRRETQEKYTDFGRTLAVLDDRDGDGTRDVAVPDPGLWDPPQRPGRVLILAGRDGRVIETIESPRGEVSFGHSVAELSDLDADGQHELAIAIPEHPMRDLTFAGRVDVLGTRSGDVLWSQTGQNGDRRWVDMDYHGDGFGALLASVGDVDGDGFGDVAVLSVRNGLGKDNWSQANLVSGKDGAILATYQGQREHIRFSWQVCGLGDLDGDGRAEFAIGAMDDSPGPGEEWDDALYGRVYVCRYRPEATRYIRGDADQDGDVDLTDSIAILMSLFGGEPGACEEAMDVDRSGKVNVTDAIIVLVYRFMGGMTPLPPFPGCGRLESPRGELPCERSFCD